MPFYEYRCEHCGEVVTARQRMDDPPLDVCGDRCLSDDDTRGTGRLTRLMSVPIVGKAAAAAPAAPQRCASCPGAGACGLDA